MNPFLFSIPETSDNLQSDIQTFMFNGYRPLAYYMDADKKITCLFGNDNTHKVELLRFNLLEGNRYPCLTNSFKQFHMFERELWEETGILPESHPWLKPLRYPNEISRHSIKDHPFLKATSESMHEVAVGPVHAGVIEPGHFRFLCEGEDVHHLEIQLGYQHRGIRALLEKGDVRNKIHLAEAIAGDTAIGHGLAYCRAIEKLCEVNVPDNVQTVRAIALEMERTAMHLADLSALAGDIGYLIGLNYFAAVRTKVINLSLHICGSRFGKRWLCPGGINYGISHEQNEYMMKLLTTIREDIRVMGTAMFNDASVLSRFDGTGHVDAKSIEDLNFSGMVARSGGVLRDSRRTYPFFPYAQFEESIILPQGDVFARAFLRYKESIQSIDFCLKLLSNLPETPSYQAPLSRPKANVIVASIVEGWRGEIIHIIRTDEDSNTMSYRIYDPSFHNWMALALAVRDNGISDFPVCNKSFNLSYCGNDL